MAASAASNANRNTIANAPVLASGQPVTDQLGPPDWVFYRLDLQAGETTTIDFSVDDRGNAVCLTTYDPHINDYNYTSADTQKIGSGFTCTDANSAAAEIKGKVPMSGRWTLMLQGCDLGCWGTPNQFGYHLTVLVSGSAGPPANRQAQRSQLVVACCDSFASGEGTQAFPAISSGCHRTDAAWPNLLPYPAVNVACSGAKINALFTSFKDQAPQLQQMKSLRPGAVVMMDGGNDALYSAALKACYKPRTTCAAGALNQNFAAIRLLRGKLAGAYEAVVETTGAKLFAVGYPRVFPSYPQPAINCSWLNDSERFMLNKLGDELQQAQIGAVADANRYLGLKGKARIQFVSTQNVLAGHELCSTRSWMFKIDFPACIKDSRCGHPTAPGQEAIAGAVRKPLKAYLG